ncbi:hypothetical protein BK816_02630 [Boudabousia tangfeifanii]|uniref:Pilus assembly protein TadE n=1 Tax=Boudabousia tangfeifanii TaxID=1912795 RepID=A0A1D9MJH4_9ACTO|nr:hypothetical protein BK816_02630 [Boudabousia tangfeifanii]
MDESGEATIEFIGIFAALGLPILALILSLANLQAGTFAAQSLAQTTLHQVSQGVQDPALLQAQATLVQKDFQLSTPPVVNYNCGRCQLGDFIAVKVNWSIPLPVVPDWLGLKEHLAIKVEAQSSGLVLAERRPSSE